MIIKEQQTPYWNDNTKMITEQTCVDEFSRDGYDIVLKQEIGFFNSEPDEIILYRTYLNVYKNGEHIKRRLFYGDNGHKWKDYLNELLGFQG